MRRIQVIGHLFGARMRTDIPRVELNMWEKINQGETVSGAARFHQCVRLA